MSQQIAVEAMEEISRIVQRKVTIWDNLHANDYDQTRLYLGPYSGRDARIIEHTRGVLTNPNCEFEVNFVALHTLAQWSIDRNTRFSLPVDRECCNHNFTLSQLLKLLYSLSTDEIVEVRWVGYLAGYQIWVSDV